MDTQVNHPPPIDEIVGFLDARAPKRLQALRNMLPELADELKPGIVAGESEEILSARAQVAADGVAEMLAQSEPILAKLERRMRLVRTLRLVGQMCSAIGSASGVGFLLAKLPNPAIGSGLVAVVGSLSVIGVDYLGTLGDVKLFDHYTALREARYEAKRLEQELMLRLGRPPSERDLGVMDQLVRDANDLSKKIDKAIGQSAA
jgi:hypothetical protein